jgi:serine phosphatase RsbU (regulator of sigma subunit)
VPLLLEIVVPLSRSELRWEFFNLAVGSALLSVALSALALFFFRPRLRDLTLLYFGLFAMLFALRFLSEQPSVRSMFDVWPGFWAYFYWVITCAILLPGGLFLLQVVGRDFKPFFRWLVAAQCGFALFGILAASFGVKLTTLNLLNSVMVLAILGTAAIFSAALRYSQRPRPPLSREVRIFIAGFVVWLVSVVQANLLGVKLLKGHNLEFLGFTVFVAALGYISAHRIFANEERLLTINKELEIARQIQSSILPRRVPAISGLEIAARYLPMSAVAGDFYDFLEIDDKRVGVLIADVTGHGVPAALIASMLKVAFVGQVTNAHDPARVLAGLNTALCGKFEDHFVTAAYVYLDLQQNLLRYSGAGHPPLLRSSNTTGPEVSGAAVRSIEASGAEARGAEVSEVNARLSEQLEQNDLILGLFPEANYASLEITVNPGDRYFLYTDGVCEAKNAQQEEFGSARLLKFLETHQSGSVNQAGDELLAEIASWSKAPQNSAKPVQDDDITLLLLHVSATP